MIEQLTRETAIALFKKALNSLDSKLIERAWLLNISDKEVVFGVKTVEECYELLWDIEDFMEKDIAVMCNIYDARQAIFFNYIQGCELIYVRV